MGDLADRQREFDIQRWAIEAIREERNRQDKKWGEQNHEPAEWLAILEEEVGEYAKAYLEAKYGDGSGIQIVAELIQVAAVACSMLECALRNEWMTHRFSEQKKSPETAD